MLRDLHYASFHLEKKDFNRRVHGIGLQISNFRPHLKKKEKK